MHEKTCIDCGETKLATTEFFRPQGRGYLRSECKACSVIRDRARYRANPEKHRAQSQKRRDEQSEAVKAINRRSYEKHKEKRRAEMRERYASDPERFRAETRAYREKNLEKVTAGVRRWRLALRAEMLTAYGGCCSCCGEAHPSFLTLDHVNDDGRVHRAEMGGQNNVYTDLRRRGWPQEGFTLLCWNCHMARTYYGTCPHKVATQLAAAE